MTKREEWEEYAEKYGRQEAMIELESIFDDLTCEELLCEYCKEQIDEGNYGLVAHIMDALSKDWSDTGVYRYDYSMGTLETPSSAEFIEDVEDLIELLEE